MKKIIIVSFVLVLILGIFVGCSGGGGTQPKTAQVNVSVVDDGGTPVSGASLTMGSYSGTTDNSGKYTFSDVTSGTYTIDAVKEGYDDSSSDISVDEGETKNVNLVMAKQAAAAEMKDYSKLKSYKAVIESVSSSGTSQKIEMLQDEYGSKQHITVTDLKTGEVQFELYLEGDKAKMRSDDTWTDMPAAQASGITQGLLTFIESMVSGVTNSYNVAVTTPQGSANYSVSKEGTATVNGYATVKYLMKAKATSGAGETIAQAEIWIISGGAYKDYATRMIMNITNNGKTDTLTVDASDFGNVVVTEPS
jgi:hypothetical protein